MSVLCKLRVNTACREADQWLTRCYKITGSLVVQDPDQWQDHTALDQALTSVHVVWDMWGVSGRY